MSDKAVHKSALSLFGTSLFFQYLPSLLFIHQIQMKCVNAPSKSRHPSKKYGLSMINLNNYHYHTLITYSFIHMPQLFISSFLKTCIISAHILPSAGIVSFWTSYLMGSIGGGLGMVFEYKYHFWCLMKKQYQRQMSNFSINDHRRTDDYIDNELLDKLYHDANDNVFHFGSSNALFGMMGFEFLSCISIIFQHSIVWGNIQCLWNKIEEEDEDRISKKTRNRMHSLTYLSLNSAILVWILCTILPKIHFIFDDEKKRNKQRHGHFSAALFDENSNQMPVQNIFAFVFGMISFIITA